MILNHRQHADRGANELVRPSGNPSRVFVGKRAGRGTQTGGPQMLFAPAAALLLLAPALSPFSARQPARRARPECARAARSRTGLVVRRS